jgi:hypothetical protein
MVQGVTLDASSYFRRRKLECFVIFELLHSSVINLNMSTTRPNNSIKGRLALVTGASGG